MNPDLLLRRKWTLKATLNPRNYAPGNLRQVVFIKKPNERTAHVLMKAFIWALYLPDYPDLVIEIYIGDRYKPDVVSMIDKHTPRFWGEAGRVGVRKIQSLARRYRQTHLVIGKWATRLRPLEDIVTDALAGLNRSAPFDLLCFPEDSATRFIDDDGIIHITHDQLKWVRLY